jgi:hypothetical protein
MEAPKMTVSCPQAFHVVIPTQLTLPLPPRLSPLEALEQVSQVTPGCVPLHYRQSKGAELFAKTFDAGLVLLKWPDGVSVAVFAACIPPDDGLLMYFHGREALEAHVAGLERTV